MSSVLFLPPLRPFFLLPMSYLSIHAPGSRTRKESELGLRKSDGGDEIHLHKQSEGREEGRKEGKNEEG